MIRPMLLPVAALLVVAGCIGLLLGLRSVPPSESEIIERHAAVYVTESGGDRTDCYGVPSGVEGVRLMVICERDGSEAWYVAVDAFGNSVDEDVQSERTET